MDCISGATVRYKEKFVGGKPYNITNLPVYDASEHLHTMRQEANWAVIEQSALLPSLHIAIVALLSQSAGSSSPCPVEELREAISIFLISISRTTIEYN